MLQLGGEFLTDEFFWEGNERSLTGGAGTHALSNGNFVVILGADVFIYDSLGERISGGTFYPGAAGDDNISAGPAFAELSDGGFVLGWGISAPRPDGQFGTQNDFLLRLFNADGTARSGPLPLNQTSNENDLELSLAALGDGFVAAWRSTSDDPLDDFSQGIMFREFGANGLPEDAGQFINATRSGYQNEPDTATLTTGEVVLVYRSAPFTDQDTNEPAVLAQIFDENGSLLIPEFEINPVETGVHFNQQVTRLADGRFAVIFNSTHTPDGQTETVDVYAQIYSLDRSGAGVNVVKDGPVLRLTDNPDLAELEPRVVDTAGSGFFATWTELTGVTSGSFSEYNVVGRFYDAIGDPLGDSFAILTGFPRGLNHSISENENGAILVSWTERFPNPDLFFVPQNGTARLVEAPVEAGELDQLIRGDADPNTLDGAGGNDTIIGLDGNDLLRGFDGDDRIDGGEGEDSLDGGASNDTLDGGAGADQLLGRSGDDTYFVDNRRDRVTEAGGDGFDRIFAAAEVTLASAEIEQVILESSSNLRVNGNRFATEIQGNSGSNILIGGGGGDTITGGEGQDYFAFLIGDAPGATRITDFGGPDQIALDDRFFGLGDGSIDVRDVTQRQVENALQSGTARYDGRTGELWVDTDGQRGPREAELIAIIDGGGRVSADDFLLF